MTLPISAINCRTAKSRSPSSVRCSNKFSSMLCMFIKCFQLTMKIQQFLVGHKGFCRQLPHVVHQCCQFLLRIAGPVGQPVCEPFLERGHGKMVACPHLVL